MKILYRAQFVVLAATQFCNAQSTFQNLDFENPSLPLVHIGSSFDFVASSNAVPNWTIYLGNAQQDRVLYNDYFLGTAVVGLLGPEWAGSNPARIAGSLSINLQAGLNANSQPVPASIRQSAVVPASALSLQFRAREFLNIGGGQLAVTLDGQIIPMLPITTTANYTVFGGNISGLGGATRQLQIAAIPTVDYEFSSFTIDAIQFSNQPIPEPSVITFFSLGALFLGCRLRK